MIGGNVQTLKIIKKYYQLKHLKEISKNKLKN